ncbi:MAG: amidohydrolase family protein [Spirochaetales bacterium]|nr:amidohydrolase family protein [Spirochaetales bacterium]MCF7938101.1 amidohydrolase family protein [Spirochaetales bacterium]
MREEIKILRSRWLLSGDKAIEHGAAVVQGSRIIEVSTWPEAAKRYRAARVYGSDSHFLIPGLVNAHHHSGGFPQSLHGLEDDTLEPWLLSTMGMRSEGGYLAAALCAGRLLKSGVTSLVDMTVVDGSIQEVRKDTEDRMRGYADAGISAAIAPGVLHRSFLINGEGEDEAFLASLPEKLRKRVRELIPLSSKMGPDQYLRFIDETARSLPAGDTSAPERQKIWFGPPGPQWTDGSLLRRIVSEAERLNTRIQTHVLESFSEKLEGERSFGKGTVEHLYDIGFLSPRATLAHGVWLKEPEIELLKRTGTSVSHNPSSNLRLRAGTAPLNAMLAAGLQPALGLDANGLNDDDDMFTEMRMALRLHRSPRFEDPAPRPLDIFRMATTGGAELLGKEAELGRIEAGFRADLALIDGRRILGQWHEEHADPLYLLVTRAKAGDVDMVFAAGDPVLRSGEPVGIDPAELEERLARQLQDLKPPGQLRELIRELKPHVRSWYKSWEEPEIEAYTAFNSRR